MRRIWREQSPARGFRSTDLLRLTTGIVMLAVLGMLFARMRDPDMWRWLAGDNGKQAAQPSPAAPAPMPEATGPTDEDPDEAAAAREDYQVLVDGGPTLAPDEMVPYDRVVRWVDHQSFVRLLQRARADLFFTNFHDEPDKYRGQVVTLELNVRRVLDAGKTRDGIPLHELGGFTAESGDRLYYAIVVGLPKDMPLGQPVSEKVQFAGYFFKLQGYLPFGAAAGAVPYRAPLLIGRVERETVAMPSSDNTQELKWGAAVLAVLGAAWAILWVFFRHRRKQAAVPSPAIRTVTGEGITLDAWLERASLGANETESTSESQQP